ncbi:MAG: F510_1955 family glycosylhydrolase [Solirubrobacteraceae bacterium]
MLAAVALAACGGSDEGTAEPSAPPPASDTARLEHIHGLGVGPENGTLYVATHYGLFEAPDGEQKVRRIGDSEQDIMGFSVVSDDRFIGSGHPDPNDTDSPPNLGLIESRDGGRTWENISLSGDADFHVLQSAGERIYGFDGTQGRLMVSNDGGRSWEQRTPPAAMFDLAIDPRNENRIVTSTEGGVFASTDAGKGWRPLRDDIAGLLAWSAPGALYLVDGQGQVQRSADGGRQWQPASGIGGQPAAFIAREDELYAALGDGTVKRSTDGGASWSVRATP